MCEIIDLGGGRTAMVCNGHKMNHDHVCNDDASILILSSGERVADTDSNRVKHVKEVVGGSVACSICGRAAIDSAPYF